MYRGPIGALESKLASLRGQREAIDREILDVEEELELYAHGSRRSPYAALWLAFLLTLAFFCLISVAFVAIVPRIGHGPRSRLSRTRVEAATLRAASTLALTENPDECPTVESLVAEGFLHGPAVGHGDAWGEPFTIECVGDGDVIVRSTNNP